MEQKLKFPVSTIVKIFNSNSTPPHILIYGDSVMERISIHDKNKSTLSEMIVETIGQKKIHCVAHSGYHMGIFYQLTRLLQLLPARPRIVVLPINMRSFSPQWDLHPLHHRAEHVRIIQDYIDKLQNFSELPPYNIERQTQEDEFLSTQADYRFTDFKYICQFDNIIKSPATTEEEKRFRRQQMFIYHYLYGMNHNNRKLRLLKDVIKMLKQLDISIVSYITPINHVSAQKYIGHKFLEAFQVNLEFIFNIFEKFSQDLGRDLQSFNPEHTSHIIFRDYSLSLTPDYFFHDDDATEHLNERGRLRIAKKLSSLCLNLIN
jgi:hypothetical protein